MNDTQTPIWRPISFLATYTQLIDGTLEEAKDQLALLEQARPKPYALDDATVSRIIRCYTESATYIPLYREQLTRWERTELTTEQRREVDRLKPQVDDLADVLDAILSLAHELKQNTIDAILRKDDAELAVDVLAGKILPPQ
jgi:hypothetical protein